MNRQDISDLMIERYVLDELSPHEKEKIDALRGSDSSLDERIQLINTENEAFFTEHPAELFVERIKRQVEREKNSAKIKRETPFTLAEILQRIRDGFTVRNLVSAGAAAAVIVLVLFFAPFNSTLKDPAVEPGEGIRIKGGPSLMIYKKGEGGSSLLGDGSAVKKGDRLQISYRNSGFQYGMIVSVDGNGVITHHLPIQGGLAANLDESGRVMLPNSYELDDAPNFERFYFFASLKPFTVDDVLDAVKDADAKELKLNDSSISYSVYTLYK